VSTLKVIPATTVAENAEPVTLASHGPLTLSGQCANGAVARLLVSTTEDNSAATGTDSVITDPAPGKTASGALELDLDSGAPPFQIAQLEAGMGIRGYTVTDVSALSPSGKGFTGNVAMYRDSSGGGSCRFHGSLALQG
jgi:phage-related baseplate assembly protein